MTEGLHLARDKYRKRAAVTGARGSKTTSGVNDVLDAAIHQPGFHPRDITAGEPYTIAIGAPSFPMVKAVILPHFLRSTPSEIIHTPYNANDHLLRLHGRFGQTYIYFLSCRYPESWQGRKLYGAWIDEFPLVKEQMYDEVLTRLADREGWLLLTGTPQGPNWALERIYKVAAVRCMRGVEEVGPALDPELYFASWHTTDNPYIDQNEIDRLRTQMPAKYFKRTFEASFDIFEGQVYEDFSESIHVKRRRKFTFILPSGRSIGSGSEVVYLSSVAVGMDWGYAVDHPGAMVVVGLDKHRTWYILDLYREPGIVVMASPGTDSWIRRAQMFTAKWQPSVFLCDPSEPSNIRMFQQNGIKARPAKNEMNPGIDSIARAMKVEEETLRTHLYVMDDLRPWIEECRFYHWLPGKERPERINDDAMDATRYVIYTHGDRPFDREVGYAPASKHNTGA